MEGAGFVRRLTSAQWIFMRLLLLPLCVPQGSFGDEPLGPKQTTPLATAELEEVIVTATGTNISGIQPVGSEALNLSRGDILDTGIADLHDVLRALPQVVDV